MYYCILFFYSSGSCLFWNCLCARVALICLHYHLCQPGRALNMHEIVWDRKSFCWWYLLLFICQLSQRRSDKRDIFKKMMGFARSKIKHAWNCFFCWFSRNEFKRLLSKSLISSVSKCYKIALHCPPSLCWLSYLFFFSFSSPLTTNWLITCSPLITDWYRFSGAQQYEH